mmetsp:Transcript_28541/g.66868  ORF Transcript_28541/g.66868 Transcript_28541/m.66868 type:complete len:247 (-) Transcript_28541:2083-2823(-)
MADPLLPLLVVLFGQIEPALRKHGIDNLLLGVLRRLRALERSGPLEHRLLVFGRKQPRGKRTPDEDGVHVWLRRLGAMLDRHKAKRLAEHGPVRAGEVHEDAVGEEHEPVVLELRADALGRLGAALLLEQPTMRDVGYLLLQHDHLLQPQLPHVDLGREVRLDLEGLVCRHDLEHALAAVVEQVEALREARVDLSSVHGRRELLKLNVAVGEQPECEGLPLAARHSHADLRLEHHRHGPPADRQAE